MESVSSLKPKTGKTLDHFVIEQSLLRVPLERLRHSLRTAQRDVDAAQRKITPIVARIANLAILVASDPATRAQMLSELSTLIAQLRELRARLVILDQSCQTRYRELAVRQAHLVDLSKFDSMASSGFEAWTRIRLDRFIADFLLQTGRIETAKTFIAKRKLELHCDGDIWEELIGIEKGIRDENLQPALGWCERHRHTLKKIPSSLEFYLRMQVFLEMLRTGVPDTRRRAIGYSQKYLSQETNATEILPMLSGIMIFWAPHLEEKLIQDPSKHKYATFIGKDRFQFLADLFIQTARQVYSILPDPLLLSALSVGLSVLKTPMCRKCTDPISPVRAATSAAPDSSASTVCPICGPEMAVLAEEVPYGHHTNSLVAGDLVVLPNGNIYSRRSLDRANSVLGLGGDSSVVYDPWKPLEKYSQSELGKVFIS